MRMEDFRCREQDDGAPAPGECVEAPDPDRLVDGMIAAVEVLPDGPGTGAQVVNVPGGPIEGFCAAGEVTGGLHGAACMSGTAFGNAMIFGRIAADVLAAKKGGPLPAALPPVRPLPLREGRA